ncbi:MAG: heme-binding protein [Gammaproteobacteria bacterium]|nr:heme-binding protein [Gammaproteobacteria bacterium]MDH5659588.1 heme-binding protein [Gammaproteobacteria bacterium]
MKFILTFMLSSMIISTAFAEDKAYVTSRSMTSETANTLAISSLRACQKLGYQVSAAVVDRSGTLLAFIRDPLAGNHSISVATRKAYTAATFQTSTITMMQRKSFDALRDADKVLLIGGGVPVKIGGHFYGAIGISGAPAKKITGDVDHACAEKGIEAIREIIEFSE